MNRIVNFKETFLQELKKSNIKLVDFCHQKNFNCLLVIVVFNKKAKNEFRI